MKNIINWKNDPWLKTAYYYCYMFIYIYNKISIVLDTIIIINYETYKLAKYFNEINIKEAYKIQFIASLSLCAKKIHKNKPFFN